MSLNFIGSEKSEGNKLWDILPYLGVAFRRMIHKIFTKLRNDGVTGLLDTGITRFCHSRLAFQLYRAGILSHDTVYRTDYYTERDRAGTSEDADQFARAVLTRYEPENVIELGCGTGTLLYPYRERGIEVHGVDLSETAQRISNLPASQFELHDLTEPYSTDKMYDLVLCIEVLEHIPADAADTIVNSICGTGDVAIVTAAPPGQGGTHHVNEQPQEYWIEKFEQHGMRYNQSQSDWFTNELDLSELSWVQRNILVFEY
jgi:SAM-dependent methyltransferase